MGVHQVPEDWSATFNKNTAHTGPIFLLVFSTTRASGPARLQRPHGRPEIIYELILRHLDLFLFLTSIILITDCACARVRRASSEMQLSNATLVCSILHYGVEFPCDKEPKAKLLLSLHDWNGSVSKSKRKVTSKRNLQVHPVRCDLAQHALVIFYSYRSRFPYFKTAADNWKVSRSNLRSQLLNIIHISDVSEFCASLSLPGAMFPQSDTSRNVSLQKGFPLAGGSSQT